MSPDRGFFHIAQNWRVRNERLTLTGKECSHCGSKIFPPRPICPTCDYEVEGEFLGMGTLKVALSHIKSSKRQIEFCISIVKDNVEMTINLNGKSHTLGLKAGMQIPVFVRKSRNGGDPYYSFDLNQPASEANQDLGSSKSSK
ncbi:MAG TPA: zinc ribbon domain-containing protein [Patescibacteria group bacterium]